MAVLQDPRQSRYSLCALKYMLLLEEKVLHKGMASLGTGRLLLRISSEGLGSAFTLNVAQKIQLWRYTNKIDIKAFSNPYQHDALVNPVQDQIYRMRSRRLSIQ